MDHGSFTTLEVYQKYRIFRKEISDLVKIKFPIDEKYLLTSQLLRSSRSVTANIAEGHRRFYFLETIKFCRNARGSLEESFEHLITAYDEKYISSERLNQLKVNYNDCMKLLNGYIRYLKKTKRGAE